MNRNEKRNIEDKINDNINTFTNGYKVIWEDYCLELFPITETMISATIIDAIESHGFKLRHIGQLSNGILVVRFDYIQADNNPTEHR